MNNRTTVSGWLGTGVVNLQRLGGTATVARPRPGHTAAFGDEFWAHRSEVQQQA
ncbi:MAG: hypothetical protein ABJD68_07550 [Nakamurella sp.]